jgi:hypothetical protein
VSERGEESFSERRRLPTTFKRTFAREEKQRHKKQQQKQQQQQQQLMMNLPTTPKE